MSGHSSFVRRYISSALRCRSSCFTRTRRMASRCGVRRRSFSARSSFISESCLGTASPPDRYGRTSSSTNLGSTNAAL